MLQLVIASFDFGRVGEIVEHLSVGVLQSLGKESRTEEDAEEDAEEEE